jgi:ketosteroid isomerase-like protein
VVAIPESSMEGFVMDETTTRNTLETVDRFNAAFNSRDVDAIMALMTDDCLFDDTRPVPDGTLHAGADAVRARWNAFFARSPDARFEAEEIFGCGDRCVVRWVYHWIRDGQAGHVRGVDVFRVRDGKVSEKRSYVKG